MKFYKEISLPKLGKEDIFKPTIGNWFIQEISNNNELE
jgi:hypothetical protein